MPLCRIVIDNFKSIKHADLTLDQVVVFIGENGSGKTNVLEAIDYFYSNITSSNLRQDIFDCNNHFSNHIKIKLFFDFSDFVKIAKAQSDLSEDDADSGESENGYVGYYRKIISMVSRAQNYIYAIELSQVKGQQIRWDREYEDRSIIKGLFPLFHLNTRSLDINKWNYLWDVIGELAKVSNSERKSIESRINEILLDKDRKVAKKLRDISDIFENSNVNIKSATPKDFASTLAKVYFSGHIVQQSGKPLDYYSTGTNSVKYIELLLKAIDEISRSKLKEPIILLDEPEISLHPQLIDELSETICTVNEKLRFLVSSHSARLTKNLILFSDCIALFNIRLNKKYSEITQMKLFPQYSPISTPRVTDDHVNSYFAKSLLFVEGETELELFSNPYLHILFPQLRHIDIYKGLSDKPVLNIMHPGKTRVNTPYICLIDMDKAVGYEPATKKYIARSEYLSANPKEKFLFRNKKVHSPYVSHQHQRIDAMVNKLRVHYYQPLLSTTDSAHNEFVKAVHDYLLNYNIFTFSTTIEGALITKDSYDLALLFLQQQISSNAYANLFGLLSSSRAIDKINYLRIVFDGKSDLWQTYKSIKKRRPGSYQSIIEAASIGKKTSGWVTKFIKFFLEQELNSQDLTTRAFQKQMEDEQLRTVITSAFEKKFPELFDLLQHVCSIA